MIWFSFRIRIFWFFNGIGTVSIGWYEVKLNTAIKSMQAIRQKPLLKG
jgi:hypothetical protein